MTGLWIAIVVVVIVVVVIFGLSLCRVSSEADRALERFHRERHI